jgi:hypothetical protein
VGIEDTCNEMNIYNLAERMTNHEPKRKQIVRKQIISPGLRILTCRLFRRFFDETVNSWTIQCPVARWQLEDELETTGKEADVH